MGAKWLFFRSDAGVLCARPVLRLLGHLHVVAERCGCCAVESSSGVVGPDELRSEPSPCIQAITYLIQRHKDWRELPRRTDFFDQVVPAARLFEVRPRPEIVPLALESYPHKRTRFGSRQQVLSLKRRAQENSPGAGPPPGLLLQFLQRLPANRHSKKGATFFNEMQIFS
mgnify:CR=1 FL=1